MAFLSTPSLRRRPSQPPAISTENRPPAPPSAPWGAPWSSNEEQDVLPRSTPATLSSSPRRLMRKVSRLFSPRSKSGSSSKPLSNIRHPPVSFTAVPRPDATLSPRRSSVSSNESLDDIRQPIGLGRLHTGSLLSLASGAHDRDESHGTSVQYDRVRSLSSPNLLISPAIVSLRPKSSRNGLLRNWPPCSLPKLPQNLLNMIVSLQPRQSLPSIARASKAFCEAARAALYTRLDMCGIPPARIEDLTALLALRPDLAGRVECLIFHVWPASFCRDDPMRISILGRSAQLFGRALQKMIRLRDVTLPSFDFTLMRDFAPPAIKAATFMDDSLPEEEESRLKSWLHVQRGLASLSFPVLADSFHAPPHSESARQSPSLPPIALPSPSSSPTPSFLTRTFNLPNLDKLSASPNLIISLLSASASSSASLTSRSSPSLTQKSVALPSIFVVPRQPISRPIPHTTIHISSTLYTGLRPSTLMQALASRGTRHLTLQFSDIIDRRTIEKLLTMAGIKLGSTLSDTSFDANVYGRVEARVVPLETLELIIPISWHDDEVLFGAISAALPRFHALQNLRFAFPAGSRRLNRRNSAAKAKLTDMDYAQIAHWVKHCPSLVTVLLPSGAEWRQR